jgi:inner membrane protein
MATLLIGANLPDVDAFTYVFGSGADALAFRRGWTHGLLAMAVLPAALAGAVTGWDRFVRRRRKPQAAPARFRALLLVAFLSVLSHPLLDFLNTYGVRFLMPFSGRWFYGDTLFIVDPWMWLLLAAGVAWSRLRERRRVARASRPARAALAFAAIYVVVMMEGGLAGRQFAARLARERGMSVERLMVGPVAWNALERMVVFDTGDGYRFGRLYLGSGPSLDLLSEAWEKDASTPAALAASRMQAGRQFLTWARFPAFSEERSPGQVRVVLRDARYPGAGGTWASVVVTVPSPSADRGHVREVGYPFSGPGGPR